MSLQEKLDAQRTAFEAEAPPEAVAVIHQATEDLRNSGIMEGVLKAGAQAPAFELPDEKGKTVRSAELLSKGPLVISFYRGVW
jgi:hypothetical protein